MANLSGVNQTKIDAMSPSNILDSGSVNASKKVRIDTYAMASMTGTGNVLKLFGALPKGAKILGIRLSVGTAQTSLTFKLGTSYNDDEFVAAGNTNLQTAGSYYYSGKHYEVGQEDGDDQIILTNAGAGGTSATLYAEVEYVQ